MLRLLAHHSSVIAMCMISAHSQDELLKYTRLDFLKLRRYEEVQALIEAGYAFAARRDVAGELDRHFGALRTRERLATPDTVSQRVDK